MIYVDLIYHIFIIINNIIVEHVQGIIPKLKETGVFIYSNDSSIKVSGQNIINSIEFLHYGYNSKIGVNNNAKIYTAKIEYTKKLYFKDFASCVNFIKKLEN